MSSKTNSQRSLSGRGLRTFQTFEDGSGVTCLIDVHDYASGFTATYAANILGTPRLHLINYKNGCHAASVRCHAASVRCHAKAAALFAEAIATMTTPEWCALNAAMYADLAVGGAE